MVPSSLEELEDEEEDDDDDVAAAVADEETTLTAEGTTEGEALVSTAAAELEAAALADVVYRTCATEVLAGV